MVGLSSSNWWCWGWEIRDYGVIKHGTEATEKLLTSNVMFELGLRWLVSFSSGEIPEAAAKIALRDPKEVE